MVPARTIDELIEDVRQAALSQEVPIDTQVYRQAQKDPVQPILYAGSLDAPVCFLGRDLGKDEVRLGQPLIGAGGKLVREGILHAWQTGRAGTKYSQTQLQDALKHAILTNTVPYKPPGNKAYSESVKNRFRPFLAQLLTQFWNGHHVITLGTEAFRWFEPYGDAREFQSIGSTDERFDAAFICRIPKSADSHTQSGSKLCKIRPLPHPSPLNQRWYPQFPSMLARRLDEVRGEIALENE
jgi:uracil-DNA glycosylase